MSNVTSIDIGRVGSGDRLTMLFSGTMGPTQRSGMVGKVVHRLQRTRFAHPPCHTRKLMIPVVIRSRFIT